MKSIGSDLKILLLSTSSIRFSSIIAQSVVPLYLIGLKFSPKIASIAIAILWISNGIGSIISSFVEKKRLTFIIGFIIALMGLLLLINFKQIIFIYASIGLLGIGLGVISVLIAPLMHTLVESRDYTGIGLYSLGLSIGLILGTLISSVVIKLLNIKYVFLITVFYLIFSLIFSLRLNLNSNNVFKLNFSFKEFLKIIENKEFLKSYLVNFFYSFLLPLMISYWGIYEEYKNKLNPSYIMLFLFFMFLISTIFRYKSLHLNERTINLYEILSIFSLPILFLLINTGNLFLGIISLLIFSLPHAFIYPVSLYKAYKSLNENDLYIGNYIFSTSSGIAEFFSPVIASFAISTFSLNNLYLFFAPIAFLTLIAFLI
ncbi:MAG: MFS transporter [Caldisphaera sp.]|jgi:MFS family permease